MSMDLSMDMNSKGSSGMPTANKCNYKTGKCFNPRALKRNGEFHSLCEDHRHKQNLIQKKSDRKYQSVHAMKRKERSLHRKIIKKQRNMAVARHIFLDHQQKIQKNSISDPGLLKMESALGMDANTSLSSLLMNNDSNLLVEIPIDNGEIDDADDSFWLKHGNDDGDEEESARPLKRSKSGEGLISPSGVSDFLSFDFDEGELDDTLDLPTSELEQDGDKLISSLSTKEYDPITDMCLESPNWSTEDLSFLNDILV